MINDVLKDGPVVHASIHVGREIEAKIAEIVFLIPVYGFLAFHIEPLATRDDLGVLKDSKITVDRVFLDGFFSRFAQILGKGPDRGFRAEIVDDVGLDRFE